MMTAPVFPKAAGMEAVATVRMSFVNSNCQPEGIHDGVEPKRSGEQPERLAHWWPHQGGEEYSVETHRYPFSGKPNAKVRLGVVPAGGGETRWLTFAKPDEDVYLARVKGPADVKEDWDYEEIIKTIPAEEAFRPVSESGCSM